MAQTEYEYDVVVIGGGPGGYVAAIRAGQLGMKVACVDKRKTLGGTCLNVGCIPSKTLLQATEYYQMMKVQGAELGVETNGIKVNYEKMMLHKKKVVESLTEGIVGLFKKNKVDRVEGSAKFVDAHTIEVTFEEKTRKIGAKYFILATGSEPVELPFLKFDEKVVVSSTGALSLERVPKRMIVIGGGVIGVELASVYRRMGCEIQIVEMLDEICVAMDPTIRKSLLKILKQQGMEFHLSATVKSAKKEEDGMLITFESGGVEKNLKGDVILVAVGRKPYMEGLGLDLIGVNRSKKGFVIVDDFFKTAQKHIFAIGDLIEGPMLAHRASDEGIAVIESLAGKKDEAINYLAIPNVIYTNPEAAAVGLIETEAKEAGLEIIVGTAYFKGNARARCLADTEGLVKIIGEKKTGRLLGLHILGLHASEMIGEGTIAMMKKATLAEIAKGSHAHPTLSESIKEAAMDALHYAMH